MCGAPSLFSFNFIILDTFCENSAYAAPPLQILEPFYEGDPQMLWSEPYKTEKSIKVLISSKIAFS
jgi:hypothetical protein